MPLARTIDLTSDRSLSPGSATRSGTAARVMLLAAITALAAALLGAAYFGTRAIDGYPDPTQQWTD